jgi:hypothetical protein
MYGTVCPKAPYDVFARAVIAAWAAAPSAEDAPTQIREYARPSWKGSVTWQQKDEWHKIYEARKDPFIDVTGMGCALLLSQNLLVKVVPGDRLAAARLLCQQHKYRSRAISSSDTRYDQARTIPYSPDTANITPAAQILNHQKSSSGKCSPT